MKPSISVVIAYYDERRSAQNIGTWTQAQTLAADEFEVIVIAGSGTKVEPALSKTLREQDSLLRCDTTNPYALYCVGAAAARGDIIVFSEDHCIAEPNCLKSVQRFFNEQDVEAATIAWSCISKTAFAKAEERYNDLDRAQLESGSESWNRIRIRGFAIKRSLYESMGGFNESYWFFAEYDMSARLNELGHEVEFVPEIGIRHINSSKLGHLYEEIFSLGWHQARHCVEKKPSKYFDSSSILMKDKILPAGVSQWLATAITRSIVHELKRTTSCNASVKQSAGPWLKELPTFLIGNTKNLYFERLSAFFALMMANLKLSLLRFDDHRSAQYFEDLWSALFQHARIEYIAKNAVKPALTALTNFDAERAGDNAIGINSVEFANGRAFRWTKLASVFLLSAPDADQVVTIDTGNIVARQYCEGVSTFFWNDYLIPENQVEFDDGKLQIAVKKELCNPSKEQRLTIVSKPHPRCESETRILGLPICSIEISGNGNSGAGETKELSAAVLT